MLTIVFLILIDKETKEAEEKERAEQQKKRSAARKQRAKKFNWSSEPAAQTSDDEWLRSWREGTEDK